MLYIGSNEELPLIPRPDWETIEDDWPKRAPSLIIEDLQEREAIVKNHFYERNVAYAGSFQGCGCGFNACSAQNLSEQEDEDVYLSQMSRRALRYYIQKHSVSTLYGCWAGDESDFPDGDMELSLETLLDSEFEFPEKIRMKIISV